ncbi:hypothetical protein TSAR_014875, partial [Trichomalopsis sarcophagae]
MLTYLLSLYDAGYASWCGGELESQCYQRCGGPPYTCSKGFFSNEHSCVCGNEGNSDDSDPMDVTKTDFYKLHEPSPDI